MVTRRQFLRGLGAVGAGGIAATVAPMLAKAQYNEQTFYPDTCTCVITESWDTASDPANRLFSLVRIDHRGAEHAQIVDDSLYTTVKEENWRKNRSQQFMMAAAKLQQDQVHWEFDPGRTLLLSAPGLNVSANIKQQVQDWCDSNLGIGKVIVS